MGRGRKRRMQEKNVLQCHATEDEQPIWQGAITVMSETLPDFFSSRGKVTIVLSNHFVRYNIFHNTENVIRPDEEMALVQHQFSRIYGNAPTQWQYSLSPLERLDRPRIACAVDQALLTALLGLFEKNRLTLRSIQPYLMSIFNQYRNRIRETCWMALVEDGILCLIRLEAGCWKSIKSCRIGADWRRELATLIEREKFLTAQSPLQSKAREPILVFSPEYPEPIDVSTDQCSDAEHDERPATILEPSLWPEPSQPSEPTHLMEVNA